MSRGGRLLTEGHAMTDTRRDLIQALDRIIDRLDKQIAEQASK